MVWFGAENTGGVPEGLDRAPMDFYFLFMQQNNFNSLRLPFNHKSVRQNDPLPPGSVNPLLNPELFNPHTGTPVRYIDMLLAVVDAAAKRNIIVVLACDRLSPEAFPGEGLWYEQHGALDEAATLDSWSRLATVMCGKWNVVAADLMNEPHKATWAMGDPLTDWDKGATRVGNHVLTQCSRWLIFVQGIAVGAPVQHLRTQQPQGIRANLLTYRIAGRASASRGFVLTCLLMYNPVGRWRRRQGLLVGREPLGRNQAPNHAQRPLQARLRAPHIRPQRLRAPLLPEGGGLPRQHAQHLEPALPQRTAALGDALRHRTDGRLLRVESRPRLARKGVYLSRYLSLYVDVYL